MSDAIKVLSSLQVEIILGVKFQNAKGFVLDKDYNVPSDASILPYLAELREELFAKYGDKWQDYFDCDNYALEAIALAYRKHFIARQAGNGSAQGVAVGLLCYHPTPTTGHCVNFWIDAENEVNIFEPQTRQPIVLTNEQCASAFFYFVS